MRNFLNIYIVKSDNKKEAVFHLESFLLIDKLLKNCTSTPKTLL